MYFQITLFNLVTLCLMAATLWVAVRRYVASIESNWPLVYYSALFAYWSGYPYTLDTYWVMGGILCGLMLRFEFLGGAIEKVIRVLEVLVFVYVVWYCVKLILRW